MQHNKVGELRLFSLFGHFSLLLALSFITLGAQSFEDFKRSQSKSFQIYKDERDNAFNSYLKQHWKAYDVQDSNPLYEEAKPKEIIPAKAIRTKSIGPASTIMLILS